MISSIHFADSRQSRTFRSSLHTTIAQEIAFRMYFATSFTLPTKPPSENRLVESKSKPAVSPGIAHGVPANALKHHGRMAAAKPLQDGIVLELECVLRIQLRFRGRRGIAVIDRGHLLLLGQHGLRILDPSVVKDAPTRRRQPLAWPALQVLPGSLEVEADRIAARLHFPVVPDDPDRLVVEPRIGGPVVPDEVQVPEHQTLGVRIAKVSLHGSDNLRQIVLMNDLIGLEVERPVSRT